MSSFLSLITCITFLQSLDTGNCVATSSLSAAAAYAEFRRHFRANGTVDQVDYETRLQHFQARQKEIEVHNARTDKSWVAGLNKFADYTMGEWQALLGYKRTNPRSGASFLELGSSIGEEGVFKKLRRSVAKSRDWRHNLKTSTYIRDQGHCGSCWAVAAAGALETHAELALVGKSSGEVPPVSFAQLVNCVQNPQQCGGQGGCKGATGELAMQYVKDFGLATDADYTNTMYQSSCLETARPTLFATDYERLPTNEYAPLLRAVSDVGPVVVSVDASKWGMYQGGVFDDCPQDAIVNHAVLAIGYGRDDGVGKSYWLVRNSWGPGYGEKGHIRVQRHEEEKAYCGWDNKPEEGVGCIGGPKELPVCGMCGILSDSVYPTGVTLKL